jgi:hypothetical protein
MRYKKKGTRAITAAANDRIREAILKSQEKKDDTILVRALLNARCILWQDPRDGRICITGKSVLGIGPTLQDAAAELILVSGWVMAAEAKHT